MGRIHQAVGARAETDCKDNNKNTAAAASGGEKRNDGAKDGDARSFVRSGDGGRNGRLGERHDEAGDLIPSNATDAAGANATVSCPPPGFNSVENFNLSAWTEHPWYIQEQMPVIYQQPESFFCVRASYKQLGDDAVQVLNTANKGSVDGPQQSDGPPLKAVIPDLSDPSKLKVGLEFLPNESYGDYWVVFVGPDEGPYDYGIVSGGPPTLEGINGGGCVAGTPVQTNEAGLWLSTKEAEPEEETVEMLKQKASDLGFDLSVVLPVDHQGCQ